jgi:hypothetical protein
VLVADVDNRGTEISPDELLDLAIRAFFYDFCVIPSTSCGGRGYLAGLEPAINRLGSHSILGKACQAVTYITHGQVLQRPQLIQNAEHAYNEVVGRLSECIDGKFPAASKEIKWAAMLLGLYEVPSTVQETTVHCFLIKCHRFRSRISMAMISTRFMRLAWEPYLDRDKPCQACCIAYHRMAYLQMKMQKTVDR